MKKRTKSFLTKVFVGIFASSLIVGFTPFANVQIASEAATEKVVVNPYVEYTFDDANNFLKNTGSSAQGKDYTLVSYSSSADIKRTSNGNGYAELADNTLLYLPYGKNPFADGSLTDFTIAIDVEAKRSSWYSSILSWDSITNVGSSSDIDKYARICVRNSTSEGWLKFSDKALTGNNGGSQWDSYAKGAALYTGDTSASTTGKVTLVMSVDADASVKVQVYSGTTKVGEYSKTDLSGWSLYKASSTYKMFAIGGCLDSRYFSGTENKPTDVQQKMKGTLDNIRIYDFAMSETQMSEYATNKKIEIEQEIPEPTYKAQATPYVEYKFDDANDFYKNTGSSAATKDYSLTKTGSNQVQIGSNTHAYLDNSSTLYLPTAKNPFADGSLTDFTITVDVDAKISGWYGSIFSWDAITNVTSNSDIDQYTRICVRSSTSQDWLRFSDRKLTASNGGSQWDSYAKGKALYAGDKAASSTGWVTIVMSVDADKSITVNVYNASKQLVGSYANTNISDWSLYPASSTFKMFTIGGCMDSRSSNFNATTGLPKNPQQPLRGGLDNIRIYDFAMSEEQMSEYASKKAVQVSGVQIAESEQGKVTVDNYTPAIGSEVKFNVVANDGYALKELKVNGKTLEPVGGEYKTTMIYDGLYVEAIFDETFEAKLNAVAMGYGASVRYGGTAQYSGLRFGIEASKAGYEAIEANIPQGASVEYGVLVIPADYQTKYGTFTEENFFGANAKYHLAEQDAQGNTVDYTGALPQVMNFWTDELFYNQTNETYVYYGAITNIKEENLTRAFVGVGVVKYTVGGETTYSIMQYANGDIANNTRSIYQVAKVLLANESVDPTIKAWVKKNYVQKVESKVSVLAGKKVSILGDSISTFENYSNSTDANETIGNNEVFYNTQMGVEQTWWKQAIDNANMQLVVNNSWAGANVATNYGNETKGGCTARAQNLHSGAVNPDIIAVYMGINDCGCLTELGEFEDIADVWNGTQYVANTQTFAGAYATMVHKIVSKYSAADVFLFTLPRNDYLWKGTKEEYNALQDEYNAMIYKIAKVFGCQVVDLATVVGDNYDAYLLNDGIHPNAAGMDIITAAFETALYTYYSTKA